MKQENESCKIPAMWVFQMEGIQKFWNRSEFGIFEQQHKSLHGWAENKNREAEG
jgi:hypothetical protein